MENKIFRKHAEAMAYARVLAGQRKSTVSIVRKDSGWSVESRDMPDGSVENNEENLKIKSESMSADELISILMNAKENSLHSFEEEIFMSVLQRKYESISTEKLYSIWNIRERISMSGFREETLRQILRERENIQSPRKHRAVVTCRVCGLIIDNCTCGRGWW